MSQEERNSIINTAISNAQPFTTKDTMVTPATKTEFGDYQCNAAMSLSSALHQNPREVAQIIIEKLQPKLNGIMEELEIAGPGFINMKFKDSYLTKALGMMSDDCDGRLGVPLTE
jgi:arginyl-tRNA synthetase